jgi:Alginate export
LRASVSRIALPAVALIAIGPWALAQAPRAQAQSRYRSFRFDEDHRQPLPADQDWSDRLKWIALGGAGARALNIGGEVRVQYERLASPVFGAGTTGRDGYLLTRAFSHADLFLSPRVRVFAQLRSAGVSGRVAGARPTDSDHADLAQLFADVALAGDVPALAGAPHGGHDAVRLRVGRQEMAFGASRLVSVRDGPNLRRTFDGARLTTRMQEVTLDVIVARPTRQLAGRFDDRRDSTRLLAGLYAVRPFGSMQSRAPTRGIDAYLLRLDRSAGRFAQGTAVERRMTAGTRLWARGRRWDGDIEGMTQWGTFGSAPIRAQAVITDVGYTAPLRATPRFGLRASMTSGDRDSTDARLQSVNPLFPRAFAFTAPIGPVNLINLHPTIEFLLHKRVALLLDDDHFWRTRTSDGLYDASGALVRGPGLTSSRYYGHQLWAQLDFAATRHLRLGLAGGRFRTGPALRERPPSLDVSFALVTSTYTF